MSVDLHLRMLEGNVIDGARELAEVLREEIGPGDHLHQLTVLEESLKDLDAYETGPVCERCEGEGTVPRGPFDDPCPECTVDDDERREGAA